jgi:hypothetical protein
MTRLLEQALKKVGELSEAEQDGFGALVLDVIVSVRRWDELFAKSPDKLKMLADKAWAEHDAGGSDELDPDRM